MNTRRKKALVNRILTAQAKGRAQYAKADDAFQLLRAGAPVGDIIEVAEGRYQVTDNFAEKNTAFRQARVNRFELKKVAAMPERPKKAAPAEEETL